MKVPSLDSPLDAAVGPKSIYKVTQVVQRVKCEIYLATKDHLPPLVQTSAKGAPGRKNTNFDPKDQRSWFGKWDVTAKLELVLNDEAGIAPGVTFTAPLKNAYNLAAGANSVTLIGGAVASPTIAAVPQSFNFGVGGGASTQAVRTDDVQFTVSLKELAQEFDPALAMSSFGKPYSEIMKHYRDCAEPDFSLPNNAFLDGNLGLKEWLDSALGATEPPSLLEANRPKVYEASDFRFLTVGNHPVVSATGPSKPVPVPSIAKPGGPEPSIAAASEEQKVKRIRQEVEALNTPLEKLKSAVPNVLQNIKKVMQPIFAAVQGNPGLCPAVSAAESLNYAQEAYEAEGLYAHAASLHQRVREAASPDDSDKNKPNLGPNTDATKHILGFSEAEDDLNQVRSDINNAIAAIDNVQKHLYGLYEAYRSCKAPPARSAAKDPPIDNMSHTVQFIVSLNANATPSWSLLRIKTGTSPSFASISHSNTQTLSLVFASPAGSKASQSTESKLLGLGIQSDLNRLFSPQ
ncbi:hypothetical protein JQ615_09745 [Bradyrhizobium jicamae]|uniref:Uncharacterized protein n=1 Tax=Bradyrhizobium jicamae TaxID=280332 RepID=A0ABS5FG51_9BRAD|nr:hypothetical protein [Bradyrhizobium jicamae]MBR0795669.1 hypothetical protein [Bradyrhizobium jicamae]